MKMFWLMQMNKGMPGGLVCPTIKMYKRDVLPTIREICDANGIKHSYNASDFEFHFPTTGSTIYVFHGQDHGASIRGPNLAFMLINEVTLISELTFKAAIARARLKKAKINQVAMSGTPEEFNWAYEYFMEDPREDTDLIFGDSRENSHVNESYIQMLLDSYDEQMIQQYVEGKPVNLTGKAALYKFSRRLHVAETKKIEGAPVWVSVDFNVSPMAATLWNKVNNTGRQRGPVLRGFDEVNMKTADTYELCKAIREKTNPYDDIVVYPDPAGGGRHTSSKNLKTDIAIMKDEFGSENVKYKSQVRVRACLNASNAFIQKGNMVVDPRCKQFIVDAEQCKMKDDVFEIDKKNPKRSHWLDGFKNMIDYEFPIVITPASREARIR